MIGLIKSEILKIRTTNVWWAMLIGVVAFTGIALLINCVITAQQYSDGGGSSSSNGDPSNSPQALAANIYTSGQIIGLLLAMIMGILIVTNEFQHQTATPTFLTTPKRPAVIAAKVVAALFWGFAFALVTTVISVAIGVTFLTSGGHPTELGSSVVITSILLNVLAYGIWAVFGLGIGTLVRNQIVSIIVAMVLYLIADNVIRGGLFYLADRLNRDWISEIYYFLPSGASAVMTSNGLLPSDAPQWWAGALALAGYGVVAGVIGTVVTTRRDIS